MQKLQLPLSLKHNFCSWTTLMKVVLLKTNCNFKTICEYVSYAN